MVVQQGLRVSGPQADGCEPEAQASQIIHLVSGLETPLQSNFFFFLRLWSILVIAPWAGAAAEPRFWEPPQPQPCCPGSTSPPPFLALNQKFGAQDLFTGSLGTVEIRWPYHWCFFLY